ncbi:MAG TPA: chorismate mutase [Spirochaetia bacterium]|nr:chorismate mutase [Spirochaetia bacterium]
MTKAVRGAIQVSQNTVAAIEDAGARVAAAVLRANRIAENHIVSILFSVTEDLTASNPATGLRRMGFSATPLFCAQEPRVDGALPRVIRVLVTYDSPDGAAPVPVYMDGAEVLRPDLAGQAPGGT